MKHRLFCVCHRMRTEKTHANAHLSKWKAHIYLVSHEMIFNAIVWLPRHCIFRRSKSFSTLLRSLLIDVISWCLNHHRWQVNALQCPLFNDRKDSLSWVIPHNKKTLHANMYRVSHIKPSAAIDRCTFDWISTKKKILANKAIFTMKHNHKPPKGEHHLKHRTHSDQWQILCNESCTHHIPTNWYTEWIIQACQRGHNKSHWTIQENQSNIVHGLQCDHQTALIQGAIIRKNPNCTHRQLALDNRDIFFSFILFHFPCELKLFYHRHLQGAIEKNKTKKERNNCLLNRI